MSDTPSVSVIVPCYNHGKYLAQSVESVLSQTWKNLSVIIVNPPDTAIIFHPASFRVLQASRAPVIIGKESATCLHVSKSMPFKSSTLLVNPSSQFIEP